MKNFFQFDIDQEDVWYTITPGIVHQERPAVFGPKNVSPVTVYSFPGAQDAGMYTRSELSSFWDSILISATSRISLKNFSQKLIVSSNNNRNPDSFPFYAPWTHFFVDNIISSGCFKDRFMDTIGPVAYFLDHWGIYFSVFLFLNLITDVVVMTLRHLELFKMTGASFRFGKTLLSALYKNFFQVSFDLKIWSTRAHTHRGRRREQNLK